jgi:gliding motility-associated-like protein
VQLSVSTTVSNPQYSWSGPGIVSGASTATPTVNQPGTYTVTITSNGFVVQEDVEVTADGSQTTPTFTNPGPICTGQSFTLPTTSNNGIAGTWDQAPNTAQTTTYTFTPSTSGCATSKTIEVVVSGQVTPTFDNVGPFCPGTSFTLPSTSNNCISGTWSPAININETTVYTFSPTSSSCAIATTLTVETDLALCPDKPTIVLPNVFTPNNDNVNELYVLTLNSIEKIEYSIMNRWGELVYHTTSLTDFWNGKVKSADAAEGVYFIKYKATELNGDVLEGHTFFHLER